LERKVLGMDTLKKTMCKVYCEKHCKCEWRNEGGDDMKPSAKGQFNRADLERVARNALIFFAPAAILFLTQIQTGASFEDSVAVLYLWALNTAIDVLRKILAGK
jgi:hypothetical protein